MEIQSLTKMGILIEYLEFLLTHPRKKVNIYGYKQLLLILKEFLQHTLTQFLTYPTTGKRETLEQTELTEQTEQMERTQFLLRHLKKGTHIHFIVLVLPHLRGHEAMENLH